MDFLTLLVTLSAGAGTGWLAILLGQGTGMGLVADILIGILGGLIASVLLPSVGLTGDGLLHSLIAATLGAAISLLIVRLIDSLLADVE